MSKTIVHPPHDSLLMFVIGTSQDINLMASGVRRSKQALRCAQHQALMTISSTDGRCGMIEPWEHDHISLMMDSC